MKVSEKLRSSIRRAGEMFEIHEPLEDDREPGFEAEGLTDADTHLRRACRGLTLARILIHDGAGGLSHLKHYTALIELSFYALERTCQSLLIESNRLEPEQRLHHAEILSMSHEVGLWSKEDSARMEELYQSFRTVHYYQRGLSTHEKASAMLVIAEEAHRLAIHSKIMSTGACVC